MAARNKTACAAASCEPASTVIRLHLAEFMAALRAAGYSPLTLRSYRAAASHLGRWLDLRRIPIHTVDRQVLRSFERHLPRCQCSPPKNVFGGVVTASKRLVDHLQACGVVEPAKPEAPQEIPAISKQFAGWMTQYRGAVPLTVLRYQIALRPFLDEVGADPHAYTVSRVRDFVIRRLKKRGRPCAYLAVTALRSFLRFTCAQGMTALGLERSVPTVARWRLSSLPRYLVPKDVSKMTSSCDLSKPVGIRDRAILLLLARLALRAGDVVKLTLDAVDWKQGTIRVCGKGHREVLLPLPQDVGDALLAYLRDARPRAATNRIFLTDRAPIKPFSSSSSVSQIVHVALDRAGIKDPPSHGANLLRHSAATSMLRSGASLEAIGTVLRHRSPETTAHYAKVDVAMLRQLAQAWPKGGDAC